MSDALNLVYMTTRDKNEAIQIGRLLVEKRLVACVNILDNMTSIYQWQGNIEEDQETVMIAKTRQDLFEEVVSTVKAHHSYDCPCIVAVPIAEGNPEYLAWLVQETKTDLE